MIAGYAQRIQQKEKELRSGLKEPIEPLELSDYKR